MSGVLKYSKLTDELKLKLIFDPNNRQLTTAQALLFLNGISYTELYRKADKYNIIKNPGGFWDKDDLDLIKTGMGEVLLSQQAIKNRKQLK